MHTPAQPAPADIYQRVTDQIIEAIERGAGTWNMPWHSASAASCSPINSTTERPYRGINVLSLWCSAIANGYSTDRWATYRQWEQLGAQVRKGEKSSLVVFWKCSGQDREDEGESDTPQSSARRPVFARGYSVFNAAQVDGYDAPVTLPIPEALRNESCERFFSAIAATVRHGGNKAYYQPAADFIQMPPFEAFKDPAAYYGTLAHEHVHFTGAPSRLNRDLSGRFGNEAYAAEELIAELGSAFISARLNLTNEPRPDHAAYVASWLKVLKNDRRAIFTAASKAQQAVDWMVALNQKQETLAA